MRNRFPGFCYRCQAWVPAGGGHFERLGGEWRVQHATCAIEHRGTSDPAREARTLNKAMVRAEGTGRQAQRARRRLRDAGLVKPEGPARAVWVSVTPTNAVVLSANNSQQQRAPEEN